MPLLRLLMIYWPSVSHLFCVLTLLVCAEYKSAFGFEPNQPPYPSSVFLFLSPHSQACWWLGGAHRLRTICLPSTAAFPKDGA